MARQRLPCAAVVAAVCASHVRQLLLLCSLLRSAEAPRCCCCEARHFDQLAAAAVGAVDGSTPGYG
jgi:hypothetical protein